MNNSAKKFAFSSEENLLVSASQWRLMWLRFRRHHLAVTGSYVLFFLYFTAVFCEFVSPHDPSQRNAEYVLCRPQLPRFVDATGRWYLRPFVYDVRLEKGEWSRTYLRDDKVMYPIHFFTKGPEYFLLISIYFTLETMLLCFFLEPMN